MGSRTKRVGVFNKKTGAFIKSVAVPLTPAEEAERDAEEAAFAERKAAEANEPNTKDDS